jgi:LEA14-like dessication related protein
MKRILIVLLSLLSLGGCAAMFDRDPVQVTVAGIDPLPGEGLELRLLVKLRVQNPNDVPIEYDGVYVKLDVLDKTLATGVSDQRGIVPRFGEAVIGVPLTVSPLRFVFGALGAIGAGQLPEKLNYRLEGKLAAVGFGSTRFDATGQLPLLGTTLTRWKR